MVCIIFIAVAMVPSLEVGDILLTSVSTAAQSARDEPVPEHTPPTVVIEPVSSVSVCVSVCLCVRTCVCACVCMHACTCVVCVYVPCTSVCVLVYICACVYVPVHVFCMHMCMCPVNISGLLIAIKTYNRGIMVCTLFHNFDLQYLVSWLFSVYRSL